MTPTAPNPSPHILNRAERLLIALTVALVAIGLLQLAVMVGA